MILGRLLSCYFCNLQLFPIWLCFFLECFMSAGSDKCTHYNTACALGLGKFYFLLYKQVKHFYHYGSSDLWNPVVLSYFSCWAFKLSAVIWLFPTISPTMEPRPALCCSHEFSITALSHQKGFMMFLGCDISVEKQLWVWSLGFWGMKKQSLILLSLFYHGIL